MTVPEEIEGILKEAMEALSCLDGESLEGLERRLGELAVRGDATALAVSLGLRVKVEVFGQCVESTGKNLKVLRRLFYQASDHGLAS